MPHPDGGFFNSFAEYKAYAIDGLVPLDPEGSDFYKHVEKLLELDSYKKYVDGGITVSHTRDSSSAGYLQRGANYTTTTSLRTSWEDINQWSNKVENRESAST